MAWCGGPAAVHNMALDEVITVRAVHFVQCLVNVITHTVGSKQASIDKMWRSVNGLIEAIGQKESLAHVSEVLGTLQGSHVLRQRFVGSL